MKPARLSIYSMVHLINSMANLMTNLMRDILMKHSSAGYHGMVGRRDESCKNRGFKIQRRFTLAESVVTTVSESGGGLQTLTPSNCCCLFSPASAPKYLSTHFSTGYPGPRSVTSEAADESIGIRFDSSDISDNSRYYRATDSTRRRMSVDGEVSFPPVPQSSLHRVIHL